MNANRAGSDSELLPDVMELATTHPARLTLKYCAYLGPRGVLLR